MNLKVSLGKDIDKQDYSIDFAKQNINLTLIAGSSGTGKSVLGYHIYQQLVKQNSPNEITFVLIDNVHLEFTQWNQKSPYLYCPNITDQTKALKVLESVAEQIDQINSSTKHYFIHIEECNQFASDTERMKQIFQKLFQNKSDSKIHLIFSTSRPSKEIFADWLLEISDLKIIFKLPKPDDYITVAGEDFSNILKGVPSYKIACLRDEFIQLLPLSVEEVISAEKFRL